jgi:hypothetical protein
MTQEVLDAVGTDDRYRDPTILRFSASVASRYHKCHGSANLTVAIPGFEFPAPNDSGWKGVGTQLHEIFAVALSDWKKLLVIAAFLKELVTRRDRVKLLADKKAFIIWWFMIAKTAPPLDYDVVARGLVYKVPTVDVDGNVNGEREKAVEPRYVVAMAEAMEYVYDIIKAMDPDTLQILTEVKKEAWWLEGKYKTTVDLIVMDKNEFHCLDLKMGDIPVEAYKNTQLMYYAVTFGGITYESATLHIMQRNNMNVWVVKQDELNEFMHDIQDSERAILAGDVSLKAGSHCTFCPANPRSRSDRGSKVCPAMQELLYGSDDKAKAEEDALAEGDW